jgi:Fe-S oxidoreductase
MDDGRWAVKDLSSKVFESLDLCLACKGCTSECPSGVDMPKLKYEFMNEYYKSHRRPLRDYLFGYFHVVSQWLTPIAPLANAFMKMDWSRKIIAGVMGITDRRPFPLFAGSNHINTNKGMAGKLNNKQVIFLSDVFSRYLEPQVEQAAFNILRAAGYELKVLPVIGAGASLLSKGFVDAARRHAEKVLAAIASIDGGAGLNVVGCEPPEVYCLKHEYFALLPGRRAEIESITKNVWLLDEFLIRSGAVNTLRETVDGKFDATRKITFHPHCHQRAEPLADDGLPTGTASTLALLRAFGFEVGVIDSGCCGMAGTFGYDSEHYELSMQIGELGVLPKARAAEHLVSSGSACRLQIRQGAGKEAQHPLVLISDQLISEENK